MKVSVGLATGLLRQHFNKKYPMERFVHKNISTPTYHNHFLYLYGLMVYVCW